MQNEDIERIERTLKRLQSFIQREYKNWDHACKEECFDDYKMLQLSALYLDCYLSHAKMILEQEVG